MVEVAPVVAFVLVIVWLAALVPIALRKRSEWQLSASVTRFGQRRRRLAAGYPGVMAPNLALSAEEEEELRRAHAAQRRAERERIRRLRARRRQTLGRLAAFTSIAFVLGLVPHLHLLLDLSFIGIASLAGYGALCVRAARDEELALAPPVAAPRPVADSGGGVVVPLRPMRPAFVIVEATS